MKDSLRFLLAIIFVLTSSCTKNNKTKGNISVQDSSNYYFQKAKKTSNLRDKFKNLQLAQNQSNAHDTLFPYILDHKIYYFYISKEYDSSLIYGDSLYNYAIKNVDSTLLASSYYRKARSYLYKDDLKNALSNYYFSQKIYLQLKDSMNAGKRLVELANVQNSLGDFSSGQTNATNALKFLSFKDSTYWASALNAIALSNKSLGDFENAIKEYQNALAFSSNLIDSSSIYNNIAIINIAQQNYKEAIDILKNVDLRLSENSLKLTIEDNLQYAQWLWSGKNVSAKLKKILEKRKELNDKEGIITSYNHLSKFYAKEDLYRAQLYAKNYLNSSKEIGDISSQIDALTLLIDLSPSSEVKPHAKQLFKLKDSVEKARTHVKNIFAKIKYDEEQKIKQIENLEVVSAERKLALAKEKSEKMTILFAFIIIVLLGIFTYYLIKQEHKKDKIREIYSTEARLSKKVHDELANDIFQIMTNLNSIAPEVMNKLESVYDRTRDISKENSLINTSEKFQEELRGMINGAIASNAKTILSGFQNIKWDFYKKEQKIVIYRTIQELLVNFRKHSQANILMLKFEEEKSKLKITYKDNGVGADLARKNFSGLQNMENRISSIGGNITFQSEIQNGFMSTIYIPI